MYLQLQSSASGSLLNDALVNLGVAANNINKTQGFIAVFMIISLILNIWGFAMKQSHKKAMVKTGKIITGRVRAAAFPTFVIVLLLALMVAMWIGIDWTRLFVWLPAGVLDTKGTMTVTTFLLLASLIILAIWIAGYFSDWWFEVKQAWWGAETNFQKALRYGSNFTFWIVYGISAIVVLLVIAQITGVWKGKVKIGQD